MAAFFKKPRFKDNSCRIWFPLKLLVLLGVFALVLRLFGTSINTILPTEETGGGFESTEVRLLDLGLVGNHSFQERDSRIGFPKRPRVSIELERENYLPPRNLHLFPKLAEDHVKIVLYVHNRPHYLKVVVDSLSKVKGIGETLLIVSHDGHFEMMDGIIKSIKFCQVKQIYAPFSPHLFPDSFPGVSVTDCRERDIPGEKKCLGNADQYGNHRSTRIVSLKHHWWWMMNTVWDGLEETKGFSGHIVFIEEDHYIYPNAYRNIQLLLSLKDSKCPECFAANLAPSDVTSRGEGWESLIAEKVGNVGYSFNRSVWNIIHSKAKGFCYFDDYNWDITMWATVYPSFGNPIGSQVYSLRGPRTSAAHFGKCGLHQGQGKNNACIDGGVANFQLEHIDTIPNINRNWALYKYDKQSGYQPGFKGWGGWGDERDHHLCMSFARMYLGK